MLVLRPYVVLYRRILAKMYVRLHAMQTDANLFMHFI